MAVLVAARHMIQVFYPAESRWRLVIGSWLSNLAVPVFFIIAGFLLFRKIPDTGKKSGWPVAGRYAWRIVKLYLLWCVIYWPIDIFNWYHGTAGIAETVKAYIHSFFFLEYHCPAVVSSGAGSGGPSGLDRLPGRAGRAAAAGADRCAVCVWMHLRQLVFYRAGAYEDPGVRLVVRTKVCHHAKRSVLWQFYLTLGLWFSRKTWRMPVLLSLGGSVVFLILMYKEVSTCFNTNMVFTAAPAAVCLTELFMGFAGAYSRFFFCDPAGK